MVFVWGVLIFVAIFELPWDIVLRQVCDKLTAGSKHNKRPSAGMLAVF